MTRADYFVFAFIALLLPTLYLSLWGNGNHGEQVVIRTADQEPQYYSLYKNQRIEVEGVLGTSIIEIRDGQVRFIDSPCQGKQCIATGWLTKDGEIAACLPNGVTVQLSGHDARFDTVNF